MIKLQKLLIILAAIIVSLSATAETTSITEIELLAQQCFVCHGIKGEGAGKIPELVDLEKSDIVESMLGFKSGEEKSTIMGRYAEGYTDKEIDLLAEYFSKLKK